MNARCQKLYRTVKNRDGFTLIEMLIVIIILGILAMVIIPQITVSTEDAKVSTLKTNLTGMRSAIEIYYAQHNMTYPGVKKNDGTADAASVSECQTAFVEQLTQYSDATGKVSPQKTVGAVTYPFGPYIKGGTLPSNPFKDNATDAVAVVCDLTIDNIITPRSPSGTAGWKFLAKLGVIFANDNLKSNEIDHFTY